MFGGGERHLSDLVSALAAHGHEVYVALRPNSPLRSRLPALFTDNLITLPLRNALDIGSAVRLSRFVRERRVEIVHAHVARDYPLAAFAVSRSAHGAQLVVTRHVLFPLGRIHVLTLARRVARVIAVSEGVAGVLRAQKIFAAGKIQVIFNGIDLEKFAIHTCGFDRDAYRERLEMSAPLLVGTIGELSRVKGQEDFVRAAAIIAQRCTSVVEFVIVGEDSSPTGHTRAHLEKLINQLGIADRVRLVGHRDDTAKLLASLDVFVSTSRSEAFGLSIVEAMAAGVPVVATATEGAREFITDNTTGRLVPIGDVDALAEAVIDLLEHVKDRERLSANAREMVRARFSLERMVEATEQVYRDVLKEAITRSTEGTTFRK